MFTSKIDMEIELKTTGLFTLRVNGVFIEEYTYFEKAVQCAGEMVAAAGDTVAIVTVIGSTAKIENVPEHIVMVYDDSKNKGKMRVLITEDDVMVSLNGCHFGLPRSEKRSLTKLKDILEELAETVGVENSTVQIACGITLNSSPMKWEEFKEMVSILD